MTECICLKSRGIIYSAAFLADHHGEISIAKDLLSESDVDLSNGTEEDLNKLRLHNVIDEYGVKI